MKKKKVSRKERERLRRVIAGAGRKKKPTQKISKRTARLLKPLDKAPFKNAAAPIEFEAHHPYYSPSSGLPLAMLCPGSKNLIDWLIKTDQLPAQVVEDWQTEGTLLHSKMFPGEDLEGLDEEQTAIVEEIREEVAKIVRGAISVEYEVRLVIRDQAGNVLTYGTADIVAVFPGKVVVIDAKFGRLVHRTFLTVQGLGYCVGAMQQFDKPKADFWSLHPRIRVYGNDGQDIGMQVHRQHFDNAIPGQDAVEYVRQIIGTAEMSPNDYRPSLNACHFCKALGACKAAEKKNMSLVERNEQMPAEPAEFDDYYRKLKAAEKWVKAAVTEWRQKLSQGQPSNGYYLLATKGKRKVGDVALARVKLQAAAAVKGHNNPLVPEAPELAAFLAAGNYSLKSLQKLYKAFFTEKEFYAVMGGAVQEGAGVTRIQERRTADDD